MREFRKKLWFIAFAFFVVFDLATTFVGMELSTVTEANPYFELAYENNKYLLLASFKVGIFAFIFLMDMILKYIEKNFLDNIPIPIIPITVMLAGMEVTIGNLDVILAGGANVESIIIAVIALSIPTYLAIKMYEFRYNDKVLS